MREIAWGNLLYDFELSVESLAELQASTYDLDVNLPIVAGPRQFAGTELDHAFPEHSDDEAAATGHLQLAVQPFKVRSNRVHGHAKPFGDGAVLQIIKDALENLKLTFREPESLSHGRPFMALQHSSLC